MAKCGTFSICGLETGRRAWSLRHESQQSVLDAVLCWPRRCQKATSLAPNASWIRNCFRVPGAFAARSDLRPHSGSTPAANDLKDPLFPANGNFSRKLFTRPRVRGQACGTGQAHHGKNSHSTVFVAVIFSLQSSLPEAFSRASHTFEASDVPRSQSMQQLGARLNPQHGGGHITDG